MNFASASYLTHTIQPIIAYIENKNLYRFTLVLESSNPQEQQIFLFTDNTKVFTLEEVGEKIEMFKSVTGFPVAETVQYLVGDEVDEVEEEDVYTEFEYGELDHNDEDEQQELPEVMMVNYEELFNMEPVEVDDEEVILLQLCDAWWEKDKSGRWIGFVEEHDTDLLIDLHQTGIVLTLFNGNEEILIETKE